MLLGLLALVFYNSNATDTFDYQSFNGYEHFSFVCNQYIKIILGKGFQCIFAKKKLVIYLFIYGHITTEQICFWLTFLFTKNKYS